MYRFEQFLNPASMSTDSVQFQPIFDFQIGFLNPSSLLPWTDAFPFQFEIFAISFISLPFEMGKNLCIFSFIYSVYVLILILFLIFHLQSITQIFHSSYKYPPMVCFPSSLHHRLMFFCCFCCLVY
jgi:hypothetical protein